MHKQSKANNRLKATISNGCNFFAITCRSPGAQTQPSLTRIRTAHVPWTKTSYSASGPQNYDKSPRHHHPPSRKRSDCLLLIYEKPSSAHCPKRAGGMHSPLGGGAEPPDTSRDPGLHGSCSRFRPRACGGPPRVPFCGTVLQLRLRIEALQNGSQAKSGRSRLVPYIHRRDYLTWQIMMSGGCQNDGDKLQQIWVEQDLTVRIALVCRLLCPPRI